MVTQGCSTFSSVSLAWRGLRVMPSGALQQLRYMMKSTTALLLLSAGLATQLQAGTLATSSSKNLESSVAPTSTESIYDKIWGLAKIYKSDSNPVLQELALQGRMHLQYATGDSDQGDYGSEDRPDDVLWGDVEVRRWRLGLKSKWFGKLKLDGQIDVSPNWDPEFYGKLYDLTLTWAVSDALNLGVGKRKANLFGLEHAISSNNILTFERSLLSNTIYAGEVTGVFANGKIGNFIYTIGAFTGDDQREFTEFDAGYIFQAGVGYDLAQITGLEKALVKLDYQYSDDAGNVGGGGSFENALSLNSTWEQGRLSLSTDLLGATGRGNQSDVWGFHVIPAVYILDSLQFVMRYQFASGDNDGLRVQSRYERLAPDLTDGGRGDQYQAVYMGLNYYLYGHKLKLMAGTEYCDMSGGGDGGDFSGWTTLVGLRLSF